MASAGGRLQTYEKTCVASVEESYPSVVRFAGHVQLKGGRPRTVEAYGMMVRLLARWAGRDPAELEEEQSKLPGNLFFPKPPRPCSSARSIT